MLLLPATISRTGDPFALDDDLAPWLPDDTRGELSLFIFDCSNGVTVILKARVPGEMSLALLVTSCARATSLAAAHIFDSKESNFATRHDDVAA